MPPSLPPARRRDAAPAAVQVVVAVQPPLWAELLGMRLEREAGIVVLGTATTEEEALALTEASPEAVVLLDFEAFGQNTTGVIARVHRSAPRARVLVLARRCGEETVTAVLRAGAAGLVGKQMAYKTVLAAIRAAAVGEVWANRWVTAHVISQLIATGHAETDGDAPLLTRREWDVVNAISRGLRSREIALELGISPKTVKSHLSNIFAKTQVKGRFALALWAQGQIGPKT
jgi:DNA-binding NarL/FixJ family response regulator